jgi:hypothetical protein
MPMKTDAPTNKPKSSFVFISYPKSGRTWMRYIFRLLNADVWFTHAGHGTKRSSILKPRQFSELTLSRLGEKNIFMYRNPLDTAVSLYFQIHKHELFSLKKKLSVGYIVSALSGRLPPKDINKFVLHPAFGVENICRFNRAWLDHFNNMPDSLVVTYEEAKTDLPDVINKFITYLDLPPCDIDEIVKKSDFSEMKKFELEKESKELRLHGMRSEDPETMKVRKGLVKGYQDYLDTNTIEAAKKIAARYQFDI